LRSAYTTIPKTADAATSTDYDNLVICFLIIGIN